MKSLILFILLFLFLSKGNAYAYLDPGTGSIILQAFGAVAVVTSFYYFYKQKIKDFF